MIINESEIKQMEKRQRAALINKLNGYKSPVLLGTQDLQKNTNLTIISSFTHLGSDPALLGFIFRPLSQDSHGLKNILETKIFTVNFINEPMIKKAHQTSARYPKEVSEFDEVGFTVHYEGAFKAPFVKESSLKLGMIFKEKIDLNINNTHLVIAEINFINTLLDFEHLAEVSDVAVNGLDTYYTVKKNIRLSYAKPNIKLEEL